jgi:ABC-type transport system involved in Fe-S cluster assembly fused permease/ATPase subunit
LEVLAAAQRVAGSEFANNLPQRNSNSHALATLSGPEKSVRWQEIEVERVACGCSKEDPNKDMPRIGTCRTGVVMLARTWWSGGPGMLGKALRLVWGIGDRYTKLRIAGIVGLVIATSLLVALTPVALKLAIDGLSGKGPATGYLGPAALIVLYVAGQYLTRCFSELRFLAHGQVQGRIYRNVGLRMFEHLVRLPMKFHVERRTGAMGQIAEQGVSGCEQLLHNIIFTILPVALEFAAVAAVLMHFGHPVYFAALAFSAVAYVIVFERGASGARQPARAMSEARIEAHATLTDNLLNAETIKYYDAERIVCRRYDAALAKVEAAWRRLARQSAGNGMWVAMVFALSLGGSLLYACHEVLRGSMTVGDFVLINSYIIRFVEPLELVGLALREIVRALASLQGLFQLFEEEPEIDAIPAGVHRQQGSGELRFEAVTFGYRRDHLVLKDVTLQVLAGRTLAVVGVSGSGKSSMIRLLFRLYEPSSGRIVLDGVPISQLSLSLLRQAIAVVPQDTVLFHETLANNIAFGKHGASRAEIEEAARIAKLHAFIARQPDGYETIVGERGLKLSGGERQRVAIARAALKRPRIFVFDEATSSLDTRTEREILKNLREMAKHSTTLVIAHRLSTVTHADEIVVLHEGAIVERGVHRDLLHLNGRYAALWRAQQDEAERPPLIRGMQAPT